MSNKYASMLKLKLIMGVRLGLNTIFTQMPLLEYKFEHFCANVSEH